MWLLSTLVPGATPIAQMSHTHQPYYPIHPPSNSNQLVHKQPVYPQPLSCVRVLQTLCKPLLQPLSLSPLYPAPHNTVLRVYLSHISPNSPIYTASSHSNDARAFADRKLPPEAEPELQGSHHCYETAWDCDWPAGQGASSHAQADQWLLPASWLC